MTEEDIDSVAALLVHQIVNNADVQGHMDARIQAKRGWLVGWMFVCTAILASVICGATYSLHRRQFQMESRLYMAWEQREKFLDRQQDIRSVQDEVLHRNLCLMRALGIDDQANHIESVKD